MEDEGQENRWLVSEESLTNFIKKKRIVDVSNTNWSMTIYTLLFICALCVVASIGLIFVILLFIPLFILFSPFIGLEKYLRKNKGDNYENITKRED